MESQLCFTYLRVRRLVPLRASWPRCYRWRPSWPCSPARSETSPRPLWDPALDSQNRSSRSYKDKHRCIVRHVWIFRAKCTREKTTTNIGACSASVVSIKFKKKWKENEVKKWKLNIRENCTKCWYPVFKVIKVSLRVPRVENNADYVRIVDIVSNPEPQMCQKVRTWTVCLFLNAQRKSSSNWCPRNQLKSPPTSFSEEQKRKGHFRCVL